jgi:hypothetical protein
VLKRLDANELLPSADGIVEGLLRIFGHLGGKGLKTSIDFTDRAARSFPTTPGSALELIRNPEPARPFAWPYRTFFRLVPSCLLKDLINGVGHDQRAVALELRPPFRTGSWSETRIERGSVAPVGLAIRLRSNTNPDAPSRSYIRDIRFRVGCSSFSLSGRNAITGRWFPTSLRSVVILVVAARQSVTS